MGESVLERILVVDDNPINRRLVVEILKDFVECVEAENTQQAIELYAQAEEGSPFRAILLDIQMPGLSGMEALKMIRQCEDTARIPKEKRIPIIMITAHDTALRRAFLYGCNDCVIKPINADFLINKVKAVLANN